MLHANEVMVEELVYWVTERESMRLRKEAGGKFPHSHDPIMANNRFCNVRREDDKVTQWVRKNWYTIDRPITLVAAVVARIINHIPTLEECPYPHVCDEEYLSKLSAVLNARKARKEKVWGSAYMLTLCNTSMDKIDYFINLVRLTQQADIKLDYDTTLAQYQDKICIIKGIGSFFAGQFLADLKNTSVCPLSMAEDWLSWSAAGPGSLAGLSYFFAQTISKKRYEEAIVTAWTTVKPKLEPQLQNLHAQDFQNVMCEFAKYIRIKYDGGKARKQYDGTPG